MSAIPSTPFPLPAFNGTNTNASPAEFLKFLRSLVTQYLGDNCPRIAENKTAWVTIVDGLTDHFLGSFPLPDIVSWNTMEEKVVMTEVTLDVIRRVFLRVDDIYNGSETLLKKVFVRLLDLCRAFDMWRETEVVCGDGIFSPSHMKEKAFSTVISVFRGLGDNSPVLSGEHDPSWKTLQTILKECVDMGDGEPYAISSLLALTIPRIYCTHNTAFQF
jgi:serine/threonine-protein kinase ATR